MDCHFHEIDLDSSLTLMDLLGPLPVAGSLILSSLEGRLGLLLVTSKHGSLVGKDKHEVFNVPFLKIPLIMRKYR